MLPKGWDSYSHIGDVIPGTRLIAFKTPLNDRYFKNLPDSMKDDPKCERFTPVDVCEAVLDSSEGRHNLGLVINLTFTTKYYDPSDFIRNGVYFTKIMCPGHIVPYDDLVYDFQECLLSYFHDYPDPYTVVGIHCTHGVNRTGYMISRYLIQCEGWTPADAVKAVGEARGHPIERENYLQHLSNLQQPSRSVSQKWYNSPKKTHRRKNQRSSSKEHSINRGKRKHVSEKETEKYRKTAGPATRTQACSEQPSNSKVTTDFIPL